MRVVLRHALLLSIAVLGTTACGRAGGPPAASGSPAGTPTATPSPTLDSGHVDHATGAADVILRYDQAGGFVPPSFFVSQAPIFTLYGDGTAIFRDPMADPPPAVGGAMPNRPFRTARLTEDRIQETLTMAIGVGGLGTARLDYPNDMIADASTALFTIRAGGLDKTVSVYALGLDIPGVPDAGARAAFNLLTQRLSDFDRGGTILTDEYARSAIAASCSRAFPARSRRRPGRGPT